MLTVRQECSSLIEIDVGSALERMARISSAVARAMNLECGEWKTANKWEQ